MKLLLNLTSSPPPSSPLSQPLSRPPSRPPSQPLSRPLSKTLNVKQLRRLCKTYGLSGWTRKEHLMTQVEHHRAARKIQKFFFDKISKHQPRCSICLNCLIVPWCNLEGHRYHCECLVQFFNALGKTIDPVLKRRVPRKFVNRMNEIARLFHFKPIHFDVEKLIREKFEEEREQSVIRALEFTIQDMQKERTFIPHAQNFELLVNFLFSIKTDSALFFVESLLEINKVDKQFSFQIRLNHYLKDKLVTLTKIMEKDQEGIEKVQKLYRDNYMQFDHLVTTQENTSDFLWRLGDNLHYVDEPFVNTPQPPPQPPQTPTFPVERNIPMINPRFLAWTLAALIEQTQ